MPDTTDDPDPSPSTRLWGRLARMIAGRPEQPPVEPPTEVASAFALRIREFEDATVRDVMTPRGDIAGVEVETSLEEVLTLFAEKAHSRMPVYRESLDEPIGFVHIKDIVAELVDEGWNAETLASQPLERLVRDIKFVPESMPLPDLLLQMQTSRTHMAIVVDEFGGTAGLVCLEDVIEEIVGDLEDEHDDTGPVVHRRGRNVWDVDGLIDIEDVEEATGLKLEVEDFEDEVDTIGGLVSALAGRVPEAGDSIAHPAGWILDVLAADPRRVLRVRIRPAAKAPPKPLADGEPVGLDRGDG